VATVRKTLLVVASVLALSACSAKSVEVSTETTLDPTVTSEASTTTVKTDRIYQCTEAMQLALPGIKATLQDGSVAYATGKAGLYEAREAAVASAVQTAAKCQALLPECTLPASQWVQDVKTYAETFAANFVRAANGSVSLTPMLDPVATVDPTCV